MADPSSTPSPFPEPALARALEVTTSGVLVCSAGPGRPVRYVNRAFEQLLGRTRDELLGQDPARRRPHQPR
jgi:PAS domain-containing protein